MKVYNVIFPIWMLLFFPPVIFIALAGNFVIDSLVIIVCFFLFKLTNQGLGLKTFYKKSILKVWLFGFLADIIGAVFLFLVLIVGSGLGLPYEIEAGIAYDPFSSSMAVVIIIISMVITSFFIFLFNYHFTFRSLIVEKALRVKVALTIVIITTPWTFLLPTKWFYHY
ncbi:hypothetical protein EKG37_15020 [Robertmurraya yapensis]|uniref:Uncharacterized protein n=1 Tax=Bacillus yapensis TaxID=2492960 RepID=A0A431W2D6_9BACI|nr:hypothetical protein [Bacillus yapensis]RTR29603.1 hypothetical protein EKG37_15020 [Bacillus yapensis]TKS94949.1 hypothetical protein FAR12_15020 [Bacillus yapensis]